MQVKEDVGNFYVYVHKRQDNDKIFYVGKGKNNPQYGKKRVHTKETLRKLRQSNGTLVCDTYMGIFYNSMTEMSNSLGIERKTIEFKNRVRRIT